MGQTLGTKTYLPRCLCWWGDAAHPNSEEPSESLELGPGHRSRVNGALLAKARLQAAVALAAHRVTGRVEGRWSRRLIIELFSRRILSGRAIIEARPSPGWSILLPVARVA